MLALAGTEARSVPLVSDVAVAVVAVAVGGGGAAVVVAIAADAFAGAYPGNVKALDPGERRGGDPGVDVGCWHTETQ